MPASVRDIIKRTVLLDAGIGSFFVFRQWLVLPVFGLLWLWLETRLTGGPRPRLWKALLFGFFLMAADFAFENWGAASGYWTTSRSLLPVLAVPAEVMLTCLVGGAAWFLFAVRYRNPYFIAANLALWAAGGAIGEYVLGRFGFMTYGHGWSSIPHALVSYIATFGALYALGFLMSVKSAVKS